MNGCCFAVYRLAFGQRERATERVACKPNKSISPSTRCDYNLIVSLVVCITSQTVKFSRTQHRKLIINYKLLARKPNPNPQREFTHFCLLLAS